MRASYLGNLMGDSAMRLFFGFLSSIIAIVLLMLVLGIITAEELGTILNLSSSQIGIVKSVISKLHVLIDNLLQILSKLLTKLMSWTGVEVDLSKIKLDMDAAGGAQTDHGQGVDGSVLNPAPGSDSGRSLDSQQLSNPDAPITSPETGN